MTTKRLRQSQIRSAESTLAILFPTLKVRIVQDALSVMDDAGYGFNIAFSSGRAGVSATIRKYVGNAPLTVTGNDHPNSAPIPQVDAQEVTVCAYRSDPHSQSFKAWYAGQGEYPSNEV